MALNILVEYPESLANAMRMNKADFEREIKISALVKFFELGKISSGTAAKVLQMSRIEFLELLSDYQVGFLETDTLAEDVKHA